MNHETCCDFSHDFPSGNENLFPLTNLHSMEKNVYFRRMNTICIHTNNIVMGNSNIFKDSFGLFSFPPVQRNH